MSLIVQVGGGGGGAPPPPQKGVVITATSHVAPAGAPRQPQPPPAHVTQPFSSPSYVEPPQHVVQHHPQPQPQVIAAGLAQRPLSHSPSRQQRHRHGDGISGNRIVMNHHHHHHLPTQPLPHLPSSPLPILSPSPAGQLLHTSVNSPSLIPQNIPSGLMPRLPLQLAGRHQLSGRSVGQDNNILPPHAFRKLNRQTPQQPDDDIEMTENHQHPPRRSLMSPKHNRRNFFNNLALQDHNYCAAPPPSPPRSPTPPRSPYTNNISHGMVAAKHEQVVEDRMTSYIGPASPHYRLKQSIDEAGVGPLTPGDNESFRDRSASDNMEDGGEETETAPEADDEGQDDSVTRCICDFQHDDGYMIQCDKCSVWQHVVCMGLDKNNIPDEYLCEKCNPRPVDRKRAKALQKAREKEIFAKIRLVHDSSDDDKTKTLANLEKNRKHFSSFSRKFNGGKKDLGKKLFENKKLLKKTHKKRLLKDNARGQESSPTSPSKKSSTSPRKNNRRKSLSATDAETEPEENPGETLSLRSWIDNYEEAVTNHYSPELRARLSGAKISTNFSKAKDVNGIRCNVSLRGNGLKVLTANSFIPSDTPVIECRGKYMLNNPGLNKASKNNPYVLQHKLNSELEVLVDGTTYGNDSRFCRRASPSSGESNAVIRHHLEKGSLHLYIVASRNIEKNQEILLPSLEKKNGIIEEEMSIADELREIKKASGKLMNGNVEGRKKVLNKKRVAKRDVSKKKEEASSSEEEDDERKTEREARIAKEKERLARQREEREKEREREDKASPRKTRSAAVSDVKEEVVETVKEEVKEEVQKVIKKEEPEDTKQLTIMIPKEKGESMENSPSASDQSPVPGSVKSPSKPSLGLPDQSGLIVGVNTINYDVSFRNKTKTREERKMEMIMKAIEAMEKNEARKRNDSDEKGKPEKKRRRSNSTKTGVSGAGESQDQSSADEGYGGGKRQSGLSRGRGRKPGASLSGVRRRSRAKSGDSSAMSETETADDIVGDNNFKYPGAVCEDQDDDVSRQYIRGSRSPPGIANHLLRSAKTDRAKEVPKKPVEKPVEVQELRTQLSEPKTIGCSAKKRWLRAAMSVDMSESERPFDEGGSGASPAQASPEPDYTPLKKRRLATYSNDASEDVAAGVEGLQSPQVSERIKSLPNGIKKKLMSNLVLEAVLDKAMEDFKMPPGYNEDNALDSNNEDTSSPLINDEEMDESESSGKPRSFKDKRKEAIYKAELDRKSANSSESEEATVDAGDVQYKEAPVPGLVNNDPAHDNNVKVPENENKSEDDVPLEEKEFCMTPVQDEPLENGADEGKTDPAAVVPSQNSQFKSFFSTDLSVEDIDRQLAAKREALVKEAAEEAETMLSNNTSPGSEESRPGSAGAEPGSSNTPQVKKVVSLADYKKRKQQVGDSSVSSTPASTPTTPTPGLAASLPPLSLTSLPSLPGLDSFSRRRDSEILSEKVRSRNNSSHRTSSRPNSASNSRSPSRAPGGHKTPSSSPLPAYQEQPREDLTERLRKEFGLNIDESDDADTDGGDVVEREEKVVKEPRERKSVGVREDSRLDSRREGRDHRQSEQSRVHRRESHSHSDKNYKYDKRDYRDSRDSYKSHHRDSRYHDKRPPSHHSASRRPPHPSSPTNGPARGLHNGGSRRSGSRHNSPTRRNSQESESRYNSHSSHSYYKNESSRRNLSRNFYTQ